MTTSISEEIKKLAETLSRIEEGNDSKTLSDLVNTVIERDRSEQSPTKSNSNFNIINQHREGENIILVAADNGVGQIWIKVPQQNIDQAKAGVKNKWWKPSSKKPNLSTLVSLDGIEVKYTDDERDINWHGSAQNFIPLFKDDTFPTSDGELPDNGQHFYTGTAWDKAGTVESTRDSPN